MCIAGIDIIGFKRQMDTKRAWFLNSHRVVSGETVPDTDENVALISQPRIAVTGCYAMLKRKIVYRYTRQAFVVLLLGIAITASSMAQSAFDPAKITGNKDAKPVRQQQPQREREGHAKLSEKYEGMLSENCSPARMKAEQKVACDQIRKMGEVLRMHGQ
jgi:hypothetical protein